MYSVIDDVEACERSERVASSQESDNDGLDVDGEFGLEGDSAVSERMRNDG